MDNVKYFLINETLVDEETAMKNREILHENIVESPGGNKLFTLTFKQVLQSFNVRNWNNRIYDKNIVLNAYNKNPLIQHDIKMGTWTGEYGHPIIEKGMNELTRQMTIFPPYACWTINKYWDEGNLLMGECTTLAGGYGDMVRDRILTNYPAMASSRAIGGVDKNGHVLGSFCPITVDCVVRPSHRESYMVKDSQVTNMFNIPTGNSMTESAIYIRPEHNESFKNFLLSESASKDQIARVCDAFDMDASSMVISENAVTIKRINEDGIQTIVMPLRNLVAASYSKLFE